MSIQSLNNGQLQLSELVISNEKYTGATGFVASSSTFSSSVNGTSLTTPTITLPNTVDCVLTSNASGQLLVGGQPVGGGGGTNLLPLDNEWSGYNTFNPNPRQTWGTTITPGITITNNQLSQLNLNEGDIIYSGTSTNGLCMFSTASNNVNNQSPQIQLYPDGTQTVIQASSTNGIVELIANGTGGQIKLNSVGGVLLSSKLAFATFGNLTGSASGISSTVNLTAPSITTPSITQTANNTDITILGSGLNSAIVLDSTAGVLIEGNPVISFPPYGTLAGDSSGLTSSVDLYVKAQPSFNNGVTYGNSTATQGFVQSAINSGATIGTTQITLNLLNFSPLNSSTISGSITNFVGASNTVYCATINNNGASIPLILQVTAGTPSSGSTPISITYTSVLNNIITANMIIGVIAITPP
jgi:hypothetical protein